MTSSDPSGSGAQIRVRLAETDLEVRAAQRLRYKVFYEEFGARPNEAMAKEGLDFDDYDPLTDHVIVIDESLGPDEDKIVGTYRLLRDSRLPKDRHFYTSQEFDISSLLQSGGKLLELGRSCVLPEYRTRPVLQLLWQRIIAYVYDHNIDLLFGCASLHGTTVDADIKDQLSYLYHYHRAPDKMCPNVLPHLGIDMNILSKEEIEPRARKIFSDLPPLIKGYLRIGCGIGNGAYIDHQFNSIDVCIIGTTDQFADRYVRHYDRANQKEAVANATFINRLQGAMSTT